MGIRFSAFAPCKYFFALAAVTEKVFSTITLTNYEYFAIAILVGKWVASASRIVIFNIVRTVAILVDKWVASLRATLLIAALIVAILVDKKVNKFNREMLQIVHFPFLYCQPNSS